jgi:hypothetical protein
LRQNRSRADDRARVARECIGRLTVELCDAQARGDVVTTCNPRKLAQFLVASLQGAVLVSKLTRDPGFLDRWASELERYLSLLEVRS